MDDIPGVRDLLATEVSIKEGLSNNGFSRGPSKGVVPLCVLCVRSLGLSRYGDHKFTMTLWG